MTQPNRNIQRLETRFKVLGHVAIVVCFLFGLVALRGQTTTPTGISIDATTSVDVPVASTTASTVPFSTVSPNELLLAFISTDYLVWPNTSVLQVSGGDLTWVRVIQTNVQSGDTEIWRAFATTPLTNITVTATLSEAVVSSMTVMSFTGVDTTGVNGSGAIGAIGSGNALPGAPTASLVTTRNNSWVFGVGNDYDLALNRVLGPNQVLIHQDLSPTDDTYWVQSQSAPTPLSGTTVTINDTWPTTDRYNLSICEILPALSSETPTFSITGNLSPTGAATGATVTLTIGTATATTTVDASGDFSFTGLSNGTYTVTPVNAGYAFTPPSQTVTISGVDATAVNFTGQLALTFSVSGTISPTTGGAGATVALSGVATATATADASGNYSFSGLPNGNYTITPTNSGYTFTPVSQAVSISGADLSMINFTAQPVVVPPPVTYGISGTISPTTGGAGATVTLSGATTATATADASGNYSFSGLSNGNYTITPTNSGYTFTPVNQAVTISGASATGINFTAQAIVVPPPVTYTITGTISGAGGAAIALTGASSASTVASSSGAYSFSGLANGTYTVTPTLAGYTFNPNSQSVTVNGANATADFTASAITYSVTGTISGSGGSGATIILSGGSVGTTTANSSGTYTFSGLLNGSYTVTPSNSGYTFTPASAAVSVSGANVSSVNFTSQSTTTSISISGTISPASAGSAVTVMAMSGQATFTTVADSSGNYSFSGLANGIYSIAPSSSSYSFSPGGQTVSYLGTALTGINFSGTPQTAPVLSISGTISATGGAGATVTLSGAAISAIGTASASGAYSFSGIPNGSYTITPANTGYSFSPPSQSVVINGGSSNAVNFTAQAGYMISGTISPAQNAVGATVTLSGPVSATTTVTGSSTFAFTGLPAGTYTVTPTLVNTIFSPASQSISVASGNVTVPAFSASTTEDIVFFDNFTQPTLSPQWTVISRHGEYTQSETECNIPQQVTTGNGLTITAAAMNWSCGDFNTDGTTLDAPSIWPYITGDVQWTDFSITTGTVEVRAMFPAYATSLWPAIWMLGSNCQVTNIYTAETGYLTCPNLGGQGYVENDMVECYDSNCQVNVANPSFGACEVPYQIDANWHTYDTVWTSSSISQYKDGSLINTCQTSINSPMFLIFQIQTGGVGGTPNNADLPAQLVIDYVKVTTDTLGLLNSDAKPAQAPAPTAQPKPTNVKRTFSNLQ